MGEEIKQVSFIPEGNLEHVYRKHSGKGEMIILSLNCVKSWKGGFLVHVFLCISGLCVAVFTSDFSQ